MMDLFRTRTGDLPWPDEVRFGAVAGVLLNSFFVQQVLHKKNQKHIVVYTITASYPLTLARMGFRLVEASIPAPRMSSMQCNQKSRRHTPFCKTYRSHEIECFFGRFGPYFEAKYIVVHYIDTNLISPMTRAAKPGYATPVDDVTWINSRRLPKLKAFHQ